MESIQFIGMIIELETLFNITIPDDLLQMKLFRNVSTITETVSKILANKGDSYE